MAKTNLCERKILNTDFWKNTAVGCNLKRYYNFFKKKWIKTSFCNVMQKIFARGSTTICRLIQRKFNQNIMLSNGSGAKSKTDHEKVAAWLLKSHPEWYRSSNHRCSMKKAVLRNFAKFTGKHLCQSLFLKKVAILRPATFLKRDPGTGVFLWILRNFLEHLFHRTPLDDCFWCTKKLILFLVILIPTQTN